MGIVEDIGETNSLFCVGILLFLLISTNHGMCFRGSFMTQIINFPFCANRQALFEIHL